MIPALYLQIIEKLHETVWIRAIPSPAGKKHDEIIEINFAEQPDKRACLIPFRSRFIVKRLNVGKNTPQIELPSPADLYDIHFSLPLELSVPESWRTHRFTSNALPLIPLIMYISYEISTARLRSLSIIPSTLLFFIALAMRKHALSIRSMTYSSG